MSSGRVSLRGIRCNVLIAGTFPVLRHCLRNGAIWSRRWIIRKLKAPEELQGLHALADADQGGQGSTEARLTIEEQVVAWGERERA